MKSLDGVLDRYRVSADPLKTERRVELVLVILAGLLVLQLLWVGLRLALGGLPSPKAPSGEALAMRDSLSLETVSPEASDAIASRPLFWQGRRPPGEIVEDDPEEKKAENKAKKIQDVKLLGVFGTGEAAGIIAKVKDKQRRVAVGETINGWKLVSVGPNSAELSDGATQQTLALEIRGASNQVATVGQAEPQQTAPKRANAGQAKKKKRNKKPNKKADESVKPVLGQMSPRQLIPGEPSR